MRSGWASLLASGIAVHPGAAAAQRAAEIGLHALLTTSSPVLWAGGVYGAFRPSMRFRIAATVAAGEAGGEAAARGELLGHFLLNPTNRGGTGAYAGGGVAGIAWVLRNESGSEAAVAIAMFAIFAGLASWCAVHCFSRKRTLVEALDAMEGVPLDPRPRDRQP